MAATMKKWRRVRNPMHHTDYCSAINCSNSRKNTHNLSFFRFPKDEERCWKWVINTRRQDLLDKSTKYLNSNCKLCAKHFEDSQFMNGQKNSLIWCAVPTVFDVPNLPKALRSHRPSLKENPVAGPNVFEHFIGGETTQDHPDPTCADKIVHGAKQKDVFPSGTTVEGPSANRERKITTACYSDLTFFKKRERKVTTIGDTGMTLLKNLLTKRNTEITVAGNTDVTPPAKRQRKVIIWDTSMTSAEQARRTNDMKAICSMKGNRKCKAEDYLLETSSSARIGSPKKKMPDITAGDAVVPDFLEIKKEPTDIENQPNPEELLTARETFHDIKPIFLVKVEPESSHTNSQHHEYVCAPCVEEVSHTIKTEVFDTEGEIKMELPLLSRQHFCGVRPLFLCRAVSKSEFGCAHSEQYENKNIEGAEETFRIELNPDWLPDDEQNRHPTC